MTQRSPASALVGTQTAAMLTGKTIRTVNNWLESGIISGKQVPAERGPSGLLWKIDLSSLAPFIPVPVKEQEAILLADSGDADAQNDVALHFFTADQYGIAVPWFETAAAKGHADAMEWLATCHFKGLGVEKNQAMGLKWLGEAATREHAIARFKIDSMNLK